MENQQKAHILCEALPYIQKFKDKIFVIKYGGNAMIDEELKNSVIMDIALLNHVGINIIVVHGAGPIISKEMQKQNIEPLFMDGLRYTDEKTMNIIKKINCVLNNNIAELLKKFGCKSKDATDQLIQTKIKNKNLGLVGEIKKIKSKKIINLIKSKIIPVVSSIGYDGKNFNNINADTVAAKIAISLKAEKLTILTNINGVFEKNKLISHLGIEYAKKSIETGNINKGMIPKVLACIDCVENNVGKAHLINGTIKHSLLTEIFTDKGIGTEIVKNQIN